MSETTTKFPPRLNVRRDSAAALILLERRKQVEKGYDNSHDGKEKPGNVALAASLIAAQAYGNHLYDIAGEDAWPWTDWDKRDEYESDRVKALTVAGALILAELERELRTR